MRDSAAAYREAFFDAFKPPSRLTVSEWADAERWLTRRSTSEPGQWRTDRVPFLREPMDLLSPQEKKIKRVVLIFSSQTCAKTECGINFLGRSIDLDPGPFLLMYPTEAMAKKQVVQRIKPLLEDTSAIKKKRITDRSRDTSNSMFLYLFEGDMMLSIIGGNSGSATQAMPARYFWADECSSLAVEVDGKGDPIENAEARLTNFPNRKTLLTSTPGVEGECRISKEYETRSDKRRYQMLMPCCDTLHVIKWKDIVWDSPNSQVFYQCPGCGERVEEHHKASMLAGGEWLATAQGDGETAGFHLPAWYSPYGWLSLEKIRDEFLRAKNDRELLIGWTQKRAAEPWKEDSEAQFNASELGKRRFDTTNGNGYAKDVIPRGVLMITVGADVQGGDGASTDGVHAHIWGIGRGEERWHLGFVHVIGDPRKEATLDQLLHISSATWRRDDGAELGVALSGIDEGGSCSEEVRRWCAKTGGVWVPVRGLPQPDAPLLGPGKFPDLNRRDRPANRASDVRFYGVGYRRSVDLWRNRLAIQQQGPGYVHLGAAADDAVVAELFPWELQRTYTKGQVIRAWVLRGRRRDEGGDCARYAYAVYQLVVRQRFSANAAQMWDILEAAALATIGQQPELQPVARVKADDPRNWLNNGRIGEARKNWLSR